MTEAESIRYADQERDNPTHPRNETDVNQERGPLKRMARLLWYSFLDLLYFFYPGAVSKVHQQEATEKYWILWRDVEILYNRHADMLGIDGTTSLPHDPPNIDKFVKNELIRIEEKWQEHFLTKKGSSDAPLKPNQTANGKSNLKLLLYFYRILIKDRKKLTRREGDLNILWRDLTFIRTRMLTTDGILPPRQLPFQLDYCRGEAIRLGAQNNEELQELIIDAAVELDNIEASSSQKTESNNRTIRNIVRILTRLNNKRLQRVHEQRINKLMYQTAFSIFLLLSCILLYAHEHVLSPAMVSAENGPQIHKEVPAEQDSPQDISKKKSTQPGNQENQTVTDQRNEKASLFERISDFCRRLLLFLYSFIVMILELCKNYMKINPLFFIFFAGLTGGFLSTVMRLGKGPGDLLPGDDAYYAWYVLTKPVVGAFAAVILYVIVQADFVPNEIFSDEYLKEIISDPVGAKGFAFGCIMGFSERIIMPKVN